MQRLKKLGTVKAKSALEIKNFSYGIGFEKLDRNVFGDFIDGIEK